MKLKELLTELVPPTCLVQINTMLKNGKCVNAIQNTCLNVLFSTYAEYEVIEIMVATGVKQMLLVTIDYINH